jgi:hypothetical protein
MATYDMKTLFIKDQRKMLFINISFHSTINKMTKFPSKSGAGPAEDDQYSRPEAEGQGPPGCPWTL